MDERLKEYTEYCEAVISDRWQLPEKITYSINNRACNRWGRCAYNHTFNTAKIEIAENLLTATNDIPLITTLLHELLHAVYPGDHHGAKWKNAARILNADLHLNIQRCNSYSGYGVSLPTKNRKAWQCHCEQCGQTFTRYRRFNVNEYRCGKCGGSLTSWEEV